MRKPMPGAEGRTKAEAVADSINHLLYTLVLRCVWGQSVLDRFSVGVLGYGSAVAPGLGGSLTGRELVPISELARNPLRVETRPAPNPGAPPIKFPIWFEPQADGQTPMCGTLNRAGTILSNFLMEHPHCFPPLVINLTDGEANDGDPEVAAGRLRQLESTNGAILLFNLHMSAQATTEIMFPDSEAGLPDAFARRLFRMSSPLPPVMWGPATQAGFTVTAATRGFAFNADLAAVIRFLNIGTQIGTRNKP
jgi:hypothetical protein